MVATGSFLTMTGIASAETGIGLLIAGVGIALTALGNSLNVNTTTGERSVRMDDRAAIATAITSATAMFGGLVLPNNQSLNTSPTFPHAARDDSGFQPNKQIVVLPKNQSLNTSPEILQHGTAASCFSVPQIVVMQAAKRRNGADAGCRRRSGHSTPVFGRANESGTRLNISGRRHGRRRKIVATASPDGERLATVFFAALSFT